MDKFAFHPEGLRSVNVLKQSLDFGWRKVIKGMGCRVRLLWLGFRHQCFLDELLWARPFPSLKIQPPSEFKKK